LVEALPCRAHVESTPRLTVYRSLLKLSLGAFVQCAAELDEQIEPDGGSRL